MAPTEGMSSGELLQAQAHLWNDMYAFVRSFSLKCAIELGIPDAVYNHGKPIPLDELATAIAIPSCRVENLRRLMSLLVYSGYFEQALPVPGTNQEVYSLTPNSMILVKEQGATIAPLIEMILYPPLFDPWHALAAWIKKDHPPSPLEMSLGMFMWDATAKMPEVGEMMRKGMESDSEVVAKVIVEKCADQFQGVKSLVEVAGNTGKIALALAKAFPQIKCTLLELPHVIDAIEKDEAIEYVAGDMFVRIPPADVLVLKWVLMTLNDEDCLKVLKRCKEAIPSKEKGGKVIILEKVLEVGADGIHPRLTETQLFFDMEMMVHYNGKQRTEGEWKKLFDEAGFKEYKILPAMGVRCIMEVYH